MVESRWAMAITVLPCHQRHQLLLDRRLDFAIQRRGGLVEDQDRGVLQQHAGNGDALALPARELDAPLADMGVVTPALLGIDQPGDHVGHLAPARPLRSSAHRSPSGGRT